MSADVPEGQPTRKVSARIREFHTIDGVRIVRTTTMYVDADTGQPLDVRTSDTPMPPMIRWADEEALLPEPSEDW